MTTLKLEDTALLQLPTGEVRAIKVTPKTPVNLGKYGSFAASELVGKQPGFLYEIVDKKLQIQPPKYLEELVDTNANNELIMDGDAVQPLTGVEIEALKKSGAKATEIIKAQIEQHANYELKTEYSKDKYKKRKEAKFSKTVTIIESTMFNIAEYWYTKDPARARYMRPDALAQMVTLADVSPGKRFLVVDDTGGLVVSDVLDRLGGSGRALSLTDVLHAYSYPCLSTMNFTPEVLSPLESINWAHTEEDWEPVHDFLAEESAPPLNESAEARKRREAREAQRLAKRAETFGTLQSARDELFAGEWDGLLIASNYEPVSIITRLLPYLAGSANIVVHSAYLQSLTDAHAKLRASPQHYLSPQVTECWLRRYQVLPGRTHPEMNMSGSGGYLLHAIKVFGDISVNSTMASERRIQRQKLAEAKRRKKAAESGAGTPNAESSRSGSRAADREVDVSAVDELMDQLSDVEDNATPEVNGHASTAPETGTTSSVVADDVDMHAAS